MNLKTMFPYGSNAFFNANHSLQSTESQSATTDALEPTPKGAQKGGKRITLRYRIFRVRPQDSDNAYASTKQTTDALVLGGLISNDDPTTIKTTVEQFKVEHYAQERIELKITYP